MYKMIREKNDNIEGFISEFFNLLKEKDSFSNSEFTAALLTRL